jgi:membrane associated rhomboid family serine protease
MNKLLARLERKLGRFAIPNLTYVIVAGMATVYVLSMLKPEFDRALVLDLEQVKRGQVWRLFTYLFLPPQAQMCGLPRPLVMLFALYFIWLMGTNLESEWGSFKYNVFWLVGMVGTTVFAVLAGGGATNEYLGATLFLAFATLFPDYQVLFMFILPVKVKWLGLLSAVGLVVSFLMGGWTQRAAILAATLNYALFFAGYWGGFFKARRVEVRQRARRAEMTEPEKPQTGGRTCAICGASEAEGADIRVCSCEKCGGVPRTLCLPHARNH